MKRENDCYSLFGNRITRRQTKKIDAWQKGLAKKFNYDPNENYALSLEENNYLGEELGLRNIVRGDQGDTLDMKNAVICGTIRMGFGHYRIAMAGASCARAMGFKPLFHRMILTWPWKYAKSSLKEVRTSEMFANLFQSIPDDVPVLTSHFYNTMGAVSWGMKNVVSMVFDNWPLAFQLVEGAKHGIQSPSAYYGFRTLKGFDGPDRVMNPADSNAVHFTGHHIDHEIVENIELDCRTRLKRMKNNEPRRFLLSMGGGRGPAGTFPVRGGTLPAAHQGGENLTPCEPWRPQGKLDLA